MAGVLSSCGLSVQEAVGKTGVKGELAGKGSDRRILAIRSDMDALPIQEKTDLDFASRKPGIMHACGHDVHATVGLGVAMVLSRLSEPLGEKYAFSFNQQRKSPRGQLDDPGGVMRDVSAVFGLHVFPSIPARSIGVRYGALTAAADDLEIFIQGESGHEPGPTRRSMLSGSPRK
ncbi:MAG UNVERIFIED_CONTAM: M20/M25/M40 family metallo-hydrolase [Microcystis novacekii LVE1205-3]